MLSVLVTAIVVLGALAAGLHFRSPVRAGLCFALAAGVFALVARRPLEDLAQPRVLLTFEVDAGHATEPGPDLGARAARIAVERIERLGYKGTEVTSAGATFSVRVPAPAEEAGRIGSALLVTGELEFVAVADETDFFAEYRDRADLPPGLRVDVEHAHLGPGRTGPATAPSRRAPRGKAWRRPSTG